MARQHDIHTQRALDLSLNAAGVLGLFLIAFGATWAFHDLKAQCSAPNVQATLQASAQQLRLVHAELAATRTEFKATETRVSALTRRIPPEPRESDVLNDIARIAKEVGFVLRDCQPAGPVDASGCHQLPIHLSGSADYAGICRFLDQIDRLPRLATIERLEITSAPNATVYPLSMTVAVYFTNRTTNDVAMKGPKHG